MKHKFINAASAILFAGFGVIQAAQAPVLVELFTSEGCSSCPPADALLEKLDGEAVVLSEHVDYWNHIGWRDPYSSSLFSDRQRNYATRFRLDGVYTPQMVVNGQIEFVGSDSRRARSAITQATQGPKASIRIVRLPETSQVRIEVDAMDGKAADIYLALASPEAYSQVSRGENSGRRLHHVAVVRSLTMLGTARRGEPFSKVANVGAKQGELRIVAFVQERGLGRVLGTAVVQ